jgi:hypothetical protein
MNFGWDKNGQPLRHNELPKMQKMLKSSSQYLQFCRVHCSSIAGSFYSDQIYSYSEKLGLSLYLRDQKLKKTNY